jgi:hypothetical protein
VPAVGDILEFEVQPLLCGRVLTDKAKTCGRYSKNYTTAWSTAAAGCFLRSQTLAPAGHGPVFW